MLANARMLGMNERQLLRHVYWPSALTWMFSSLHTSVGFALVGAVVGEYLGSSAGLGYKIHEAESVFDVTGVFAGMLILTIFVIVIDGVVTLIENRLLVWRAGTIDEPERRRQLRSRHTQREACKTREIPHGTPHISDRPARSRSPLAAAGLGRRGLRAGRAREAQARRSASAASRCSIISR